MNKKKPVKNFLKKKTVLSRRKNFPIRWSLFSYRNLARAMLTALKRLVAKFELSGTLNRINNNNNIINSWFICI